MNKTCYDMRKVIDPHEHMPEEIRDVFFEACRDWDNLGQNSYVNWLVGETWASDKAKIVDEWLLSNGFAKFEDVLILHWW